MTGSVIQGHSVPIQDNLHIDRVSPLVGRVTTRHYCRYGRALSCPYIRDCREDRPGTYLCFRQRLQNIGLVTGPGGLFATRLVTESGGLATNPPCDKDYSTLHRGPPQGFVTEGPRQRFVTEGGRGDRDKPLFRVTAKKVTPIRGSAESAVDNRSLKPSECSIALRLAGKAGHNHSPQLALAH